MMRSGVLILLNSRESLQNKARASCKGARVEGQKFALFWQNEVCNAEVRGESSS